MTADASQFDIEMTRACRLCDSRLLDTALELPATPLANAFECSRDAALAQPKIPLTLLVCDDCGHLQLYEVVPPELLFREYAYVSGTSQSFRRHFRQLAEYLHALCRSKTSPLAVEIGANDGVLLEELAGLGFNVLGVESATNVCADLSDEIREHVINDFFSLTLAKSIASEGVKADVIVANNVLAHVANLRDVLDGVAHLLKQDGYLVFEVSYQVDVIEKCLFDTIYHEHLDYHSVGALDPGLRRSGLQIVDVQRISSHGGSIRVIAQKSLRNRFVSRSVDEMKRLERTAGVGRPERYQRFGEDIARASQANIAAVDEFLARGSALVGLGAPAKMTTLTHTFGLTDGQLAYVVDDSPLKQDKWVPGGWAQVRSRAALDDLDSGALYVLAWNFSGPLAQSLPRFRRRMLIPLPLPHWI